MAERTWGGRRPNQTGRPKGTTKAEGQRKQRQMRAYDDEWELVQRFAKLIKHGDKQACIKALETLETK